ncbi:MAG: DGQHR domain-containing protein [Terriglobia bacterium]
MNESLKGSFTAAELEVAASIGAQSSALNDKIEELFRELVDPLLSAQDVSELLGGTGADVESALGTLVSAGTLEKSSQTVRPLDAEGLTLYRLAGVPFQRLKVVALESVVKEEASRFQFTCDGRLVRAISMVDRLDAFAGTGHQRDEIKKHVEEIAKGIRDGVQIPNSVLLVFRKAQTIEASEETVPESFIVVRPIMDDYLSVPVPGAEGQIAQKLRTVELDIPYRRAAFDEEKSILLVDGQQRTAALSFVDVEAVPTFALSVNAVVADDEEAKQIFQVANSTVKIAAQFSRALLASMGGAAPGYLKNERTRALAAQVLTLKDTASPFYDLVQYPGTKSDKKPPVAYNSLFQIVTTFADSALEFPEDGALLAKIVARAFNIVKEVWPTAWGKKPTDSRLMHGVGLRAMSGLVVHLVETNYAQYGSLESAELWKQVGASVQRLEPRLVWSEMEAVNASLATRKIWREQIANRQNTNQDISALTNFLKKV